MTDEQARDEAARELTKAEDEDEVFSSSQFSYVESIFKEGWQSALHGPAVTALKEFFEKIDDIDLDYYEEKPHKAHHLVMDIQEAIEEFNKARGAEWAKNQENR